MRTLLWATLVVAATVAGGASAQDGKVTVKGERFIIENANVKAKGGVLDADSGSLNKPGALITLYDTGGADATHRRWVMEPAGDGWVYIVNVANGQVLDAHAPTAKDKGCKVQLYTKGQGIAGQLWKLEDAGDGKKFRIRNKEGLVLNAHEPDLGKPGCKCHLWSAEGGHDESLWYIKKQTEDVANVVAGLKASLLETTRKKIEEKAQEFAQGNEGKATVELNLDEKKLKLTGKITIRHAHRWYKKTGPITWVDGYAYDHTHSVEFYFDLVTQQGDAELDMSVSIAGNKIPIKIKASEIVLAMIGG